MLIQGICLVYVYPKLKLLKLICKKLREMREVLAQLGAGDQLVKCEIVSFALVGLHFEEMM